MSLGHSIRDGVKWLAFGKVGNRLFEFLFGVALARLLVPADFGMIATIQIFTGFVGMFVAGGMGQSLIRAKQVDHDDFTAVFTLQLGVGICIYLSFFTVAPLVARFFANALYSDLIRVSALSFLLRPLVAMRNAWLNRAMNFRSRTLVDVSTGFFTGAVSVALAWLGFGVWSLTLSGLVGALFNSVWLSRLTPLTPRLNVDIGRMRRHASYGAKIVGNDVVNYLRTESKSLVVSKLAGPSFLGLLNKAESLSRLPNQLLMSPTMEPLFRAMSKQQDDLDEVKRLFYRAITLLMAYTAPAYVLLWWIAEPFITVIYGAKWIEAGAPMSVLVLAGFFLNVTLPCSTLLAVRDRLAQELVATALNIPVMIGVCIAGLQWGLTGVAAGVVLSQALLSVQFYMLARKAVPTRLVELIRAVVPGLGLAAVTFAVLALAHVAVGNFEHSHPAMYLVAMSAVGGGAVIAAFLFIPLADLRQESDRWRAFAAARWANLVRLRR